jgi:hypothetical protein
MVSNRRKPPVNNSSRVLGDRTFAAISAVEGLKLGRASKERMSSMKERNLRPAQKRAEVLRAFSHKDR